MDGATHPTTIFLSVHKGASTFVAGWLAFAATRLFPGLRHLPMGELCEDGRPPADLPLPPTGVLATRVYPDLYERLVEEPTPPGGRFADKRLIMVRRDPRDVAVSWYYSSAFSHPVPAADAERFLRRRAELRQAGVHEGIRRFTAAQAIDEFRATARFLERHPGTCEAPYELLVSDLPGWLTLVAGHLDWPAAVVEHLAPAFAAEIAAPTVEDPTRHKRRVTPGNWRAVFDEELCRRFEDDLGTDLTNAGYGGDDVACREGKGRRDEGTDGSRVVATDSNM